MELYFYIKHFYRDDYIGYYLYTILILLESQGKNIVLFLIHLQLGFHKYYIISGVSNSRVHTRKFVFMFFRLNVYFFSLFALFVQTQNNLLKHSERILYFIIDLFFLNVSTYKAINIFWTSNIFFIIWILTYCRYVFCLITSIIIQ